MPFNNIGEILNNVKNVSSQISSRLDLDALSKSQSPLVYWVGCADSRVSPNIVTGTDLGEMFVHRNVANLTNIEDDNFVSAMEYAVGVLKVKHLVVCGHSGCGGVNAAMNKSYPTETIKKWLSKPERDFEWAVKNSSKKIVEADKLNFLAKLNAQNQIKGLLEHKMIKEAVANGELQLHALFYDIKSSSLESLLTLDNDQISAA